MNWKTYTLAAESFSSFCFWSSDSIERGSDRRVSMMRSVVKTRSPFSVINIFHDELCSAFGRRGRYLWSSQAFYQFSTKKYLMNLPARNLSKTYILQILLSASSKTEWKTRRIFCIPYSIHRCMFNWRRSGKMGVRNKWHSVHERNKRRAYRMFWRYRWWKPHVCFYEKRERHSQ
jgi:hypothetical protein